MRRNIACLNSSQTEKEFGCVRHLCVADFSESVNNNNPQGNALGILLRLLYAKSSTTFSQSLYNERRTRLCCLVILQKYNSNLAPSRHLLYCYLGTKRERNAYPFQKNCTNCTANLANILLCNSMDGLQPPDEF